MVFSSISFSAFLIFSFNSSISLLFSAILLSKVKEAVNLLFFHLD
jgi:hypothetical protein